MFIFSLSHMGMAVLLLGGQVIDSKMGAGCMVEKIPLPPSSLMDFNLYPISHIHLPRISRILTEFRIGPISSRGEDWYNIILPPSIIKQRAWALNEGCCVEEYMFILTLAHMVMAVLFLGGIKLIPRWGRGGWARRILSLSHLSWISTCSP